MDSIPVAQLGRRVLSPMRSFWFYLCTKKNEFPTDQMKAGWNGMGVLSYLECAISVIYLQRTKLNFLDRPNEGWMKLNARQGLADSIRAY